MELQLIVSLINAIEMIQDTTGLDTDSIIELLGIENTDIISEIKKLS
jgi:hypothetical protein